MKNKILGILEKNGRMSVDDIASIVGESKETVSKTLLELEADNIICGYHTIINWDKVGEEKADAFIEVGVTPQKGVGFDQIAASISAYTEVNSIFLVSGSCDFLVFIEGKSMREIAMFVSSKLSTIDGVIRTATQFVLKKYKHDGFVVEGTERDERNEIS